jgi:hypothetical protein
MWRAEILVGGSTAETGYAEEGTWQPIRPVNEFSNIYLPPYLWDNQADAESTLDRLYPELGPEQKRAVWVF